MGWQRMIWRCPAACLVLLAVVTPALAGDVKETLAGDEKETLAEEDEPQMEEVVVRGTSVRETHTNIGSVTAIGFDAIGLVRANHVNEILARVPGTWISRGSGQEHLTAIRSAVLTGSGACGGFLFLENGIPIRPAGFCNVNNLFELNTEQARRIEVIRGPASANYGGNALHGIVNAISIDERRGNSGSLEIGPEGHLRGEIDGGIETTVRVNALTARSNGYRDDTGHEQHKLSALWRTNIGDWRAVHTLSATSLQQETGGFVIGKDAYRNDALRRTNPNPEAYRDAWSVRVGSHWSRRSDTYEITIVPYARRSGMEFLQHFLPGQPLERNDQTSFGALLRLDRTLARAEWRSGAHVEVMNASLYEHQDGPATGSAFLVATLPPGTHYDYDIAGTMAAVFYDVEYSLVPERVDLVHSLRLESLAYDYDNHHLTGNTRDDGSACGFGGCRYTRPADREDRFTDLGGRLGLVWQAAPEVQWFAAAGVGFRPPQATELYRLQNGQTVADLDGESILSVEAGVRFSLEAVRGSVVAYRENVRDQILRNADRFNIAAGKTAAVGVEFDLGLDVLENHSIHLVGSWARHEYAFDLQARGETFTDGNAVDTAPEWLGSARWNARFALGALRADGELELVFVGWHFVNADNTARYDGHTLLHWRGSLRLSRHLRLMGRVNNLLDEQFADRADFAFGNYRYFPGLPRQAFIGVEYKLN